MPLTHDSQEERAAFLEIKSLCANDQVKYNLSDVTLLRFLRGRKHDVEAAGKAIVRHCKWRTDESVATITEEEIKKELSIGKLQVHGTDKLGRPVFYIFAQRHNKDDRDIVEMKKYIIYSLEKALCRTLPTEEKIIIVFDLTNFSLRCMDYEVLKMLIDILGNHYF
jgi:CRAL/TRIO domain